MLRWHDRQRTVVHLHGYTKSLSTAPAVAARGAGFATVCTLHDFFAACPNGAFYNYRRQEPCTLRALSPACLVTACDKRHALHKAYRTARGALQRSVAGFPGCVSHYIALSSRSAAVLRPYLPSDARLYPLANIIDVKRARPVDTGSNRPLMVVGRLDEEKGVILAALAAAYVGLPIVFVGDGPRRAAIEATGARVTGWLTAEDVQRELATARCLLFPSLWYETFGLVVSEAAARGIPAIVSDISAPADRVVDGESGWVFRSGDFEDLRRCLEITRDDTAVRAAGAAAYRDYWNSPSDPQHHVARLLSIYADVVSASTDAACADSSDNARASPAASNQRQSMNLVSSANAPARTMAAADPNHPTAAQ